MKTNSETAATEPVDSPEKLVANALNEHGFLLQQAVRRELDLHTTNCMTEQGGWQCIASEYPVTAADGFQTRIDLLLKHCNGVGDYICLECKRANPKYKLWVFFGAESCSARAGLSVETITVDRYPSTKIDSRHRLVQRSNYAAIQKFSYYVEAARKRDKSSSTASTEAIEKAFYQVIKGHSGLIEKLKTPNESGRFLSIPVVVTTAELLEASFEAKDVSLESGMLDAQHIKLLPLKYCAVNYSADDSLALKHLTLHERSVGINDMVNAQVRTIFVVHASALTEFLKWAGSNLLSL